MHIPGIAMRFIDFMRRYLFAWAVLASIFVWYIAASSPLPFIQKSDGHTLWMPRFIYAVHEFSQGRIPLWNEYQLCGMSLLFDGSTNILNPAFLFSFIFSPAWAYTLDVVVGYICIILFSWLYFREHDFSVYAALIGTVGYVLSGQVVYWSQYHGMNLSLVCFPLTLFAFRRFERTNDTRYLAGAFFATMLSCVSGFIEFSLIVAFSVIAEGVDDFSWKGVRRAVERRAPAVILGVLAASFIILPTVETAIFSHRYYVTEGARDSVMLLSWLLWGNSINLVSAYEHYYGIILLALAIYSLRIGAARRALFFVVTSFGITLALFIIVFILPCIFKIGAETDFMRAQFVLTMALSICAAMGADAYIKRARSTGRSLPIELLIAGVVSVAWWLILYRTMELRADHIAWAGMGMIACFSLSKFAKRVRAERIMLLMVALIVSCGMFYGFGCVRGEIRNSMSLHGFTMLDPWHREQLPVPFLSGEWRVVSCFNAGRKHVEDWGAADRVRMVGGYGTFFPQTVFKRLKRDDMIEAEVTKTTHFQCNKSVDCDLLARYGVRYLLKDGEGALDVARSGWNKVIDIPRYVYINKVDPKKIKANDNIEIYENPSYVGRAYISDEKGQIIRGLRIIANTNSYVKIEADAKKGDRIVLADSWFPGWMCYYNGERKKGFDADGFRGYIAENDGPATIEWRFMPVTFIYGLILSVTAYLLFLVYYLAVKNKKIK